MVAKKKPAKKPHRKHPLPTPLEALGAYVKGMQNSCDWNSSDIRAHAQNESIRIRDLLNRTNKIVNDLEIKVAELEKRFEYVAYPFVQPTYVEHGGGTGPMPPLKIDGTL